MLRAPYPHATGFQLTPARGRKLLVRIFFTGGGISTHPREGTKTTRIEPFFEVFNFNSPPRGDENGLFRRSEARGEISTHPREGTKTRVLIICDSLEHFNSPPRGDENFCTGVQSSLVMISTHPREGTKTMEVHMMVTRKLFQLTPARGRRRVVWRIEVIG